MATIDVKDASGATIPIEKPLAPGSAPDAASRPVAFSTEGKAQLGSLTEAAPANDTASSGLNGRLQRIAQRITSLIALLPASLGPKLGAASLSVVPASDATFAVSADQDPVFDHAAGTKTAVTGSATVLNPAAGCKFARISTDVDIFVNTAGNAAVDDGTSIRILANQPEVIPVVGGTAVKALSAGGSATVRCTPMKVR